MNEDLKNEIRVRGQVVYWLYNIIKICYVYSVINFLVFEEFFLLIYNEFMKLVFNDRKIDVFFQ